MTGHWAYYNENDPQAAEWLRELMKRGLIPYGDVDDRDIRDVHPGDLGHFTQCHFFAGIGGWAEALRLAQWPADRPVWTGSPPCQPFSNAGKRQAQADKRHLWPEWFRIIRERRPAIIFGEQVASAIKHGWLDGICTDMEGESYAVAATVLPACGVNAPHKRDRLLFVAYRYPEQLDRTGPRQHHGRGEPSDGRGVVFADGATSQRWRFATPARGRDGGFWADCEFVIGPDGKARRVKPGVCLLAHGVPARVAKLRGLGNAIVPQVAAEVIRPFV